MDLQTSVFWLTGAAFFAVQLAIVLALLRQTRSSDSRVAAHGRLEIVWTLVPASMIAALALMLGGLTVGSWTDADDPVSEQPALILRWVGPEDEGSSR